MHFFAIPTYGFERVRIKTIPTGINHLQVKVIYLTYNICERFTVL